MLTEAVPACKVMDVVKAAIPGTVGAALRRTPPVTVVVNIAEITIVEEAVASWET